MESADNRTPLSNRPRSETVNLFFCECPRRLFYHFLLATLALVILILLIVIIVKSTKHNESPAAERIYRFEQSWSRAICLNTSQCIEPLPKTWAITRLSTQMSDGPQLSECTKQAFNKDMIKDLIEKLSVAWPILHKDGKVEEIWEDAWKVDGNCTGWKETDTEKTAEEVYFKHALDLAANVPIEATLAKNDIVPHPVIRYTTQKVNQALSKATLHLICHAIDGLYYLTSIEQCFNTKGVDDKETLQPYDCLAGKGNCSQPFLYIL